MTNLGDNFSVAMRGLFPSYVHWSWLRDFVGGETLMEVERPFVAHASTRRVLEFASGRHCGREALRQLDMSDVPILCATDRRPIWPAGIVGSITHTDEFCAAAVARTSDAMAIGIDAERPSKMQADLWSQFCTRSEIAAIAAQSCARQNLAATLTFAAKEAFFKCLYPLTQCWIEFQEAVVEIGDGLFIVRSKHLAMLPREHRFGLSGRFMAIGDVVITALVIPRVG